MINRGNRILIVFHLYCCSKHKLSDDTHGECCEPCLFCHVNILVQNVIQFLFYLYTLDMAGLPLWDIIIIIIVVLICKSVAAFIFEIMNCRNYHVISKVT